MQHLSTAFLILALVIAVNQGGVTAQGDGADQVADESKNRAVTIIEGPKYVATPAPSPPPANRTDSPPRAPSPPRAAPEPRPPRPRAPAHHGPPQRHLYPKPMKLRHSNSIYRVIPLSHRHYSKPPPRQPVFAASNRKPVRVPLAPPKFSVPIETINGIRTDVVRPPKSAERPTTTTTSTTTTTTTTQRPLRNKRIWPKNLLEKRMGVVNKTASDNTTDFNNSTSTNSTDLEIASATHYRFRYVNTNRTAQASTTFVPLTITRGYRRVHRVPKHTTTTAAYDPDVDTNFTRIPLNDWVPIVPSHYPKKRRLVQTPMSRRSDGFYAIQEESPEEIPEEIADESKRTMYLQSYGLVPVPSSQATRLLAAPSAAAPAVARKKMVIFRKKKRPLNPYVYSGYSTQPVVRAPATYLADDLHPDASHHARVVTRIKHHHHHHHHRYIKTVEKPVKVPYKVEVPKPFPVPVEKKVPVPYPVQVEKRIPYPVKVPHPVPYKVVEKEYVPKPYPVVQQVQVPVLKHVEVKVPQPYPVEKRVPYPVEVRVPVDRPYPVTVEKRVPYPVPVKVLVPQPYPVEVKVPEPVEVVKHVPVRVSVPQPYPVRVPTPVAVPVEKRVPYPVEVEKKVPVPYKVIVPQKVEVEKRVPVYVPRPYPVEKRVAVPIRVPYPVEVPSKVPIYNEVPVYISRPYQYPSVEDYGHSGHSVSGGVTVSNEVTSSPHHTVTVHGNTGFAGFQSRSDKTERPSSAESSESTTALTTTTSEETTATTQSS